jgi:hypothetical protein
MSRRRESYVKASRCTPLVTFIAVQQDEPLTLTFAEIESIIGTPLSVSAQVIPSIWWSQSSRLSRDLTAIGWRERLLIPAHAVEFRRIVPGPYAGTFASCFSRYNSSIESRDNAGAAAMAERQADGLIR